MKQAIILFTLVIFSLGGCTLYASEDIKSMNVKEFFKYKKYRQLGDSRFYQRHEQLYTEIALHEKYYCEQKGGEWKDINQALSFAPNLQRLPLRRASIKALNDLIWIRNPETYKGLLLRKDSGREVFEKGKYCFIKGAPVFFYYPQHSEDDHEYTEIIFETNATELNNLQQLVNKKPLEECRNYSLKIDPLIEEWNRNTRSIKQLEGDVGSIKKPENKYQQAFENAISINIMPEYISPVIKNIPLISYRLSLAVSKDYNNRLFEEARNKRDLEDERLNAEYEKTVAPIKEKISALEKIQLHDIGPKIVALNSEYLVMLGLFNDPEDKDLCGPGPNYSLSRSIIKDLENFHRFKSSCQKKRDELEEQLYSYDISDAHEQIINACKNIEGAQQ